MQLPLVDEIRAARAALVEASAATLDLARVEAALIRLDLVERQGRSRESHPSGRPAAVLEVPGGAVVADLAEGWTALADLGQATTFAGRRAQLEQARDHLRPLAAGLATAAPALSALQHRQHAILDTPPYAREHEEIASVGAERDRLVDEVAPLEQQLGVLGPTVAALDRLLARETDPAVIAAWTERLRTLLATVGLHPELDGGRDGLARLRDVLARQIEDVRPERDRLAAERQRLDGLLLERMG